MILSYGVLSKVGAKNVVGKGKASVFGCQSQKPTLAYSTEKRDGDRDQGTNVRRLYLAGRNR